jgi:aminomethyltransferase
MGLDSPEPLVNPMSHAAPVKTPLYDVYADSGKIVDFHGWLLPVQFSGIVEEHVATRTRAGVFDCSHMGEFFIRGRAAAEAMDRLVYSDMLGLGQGRCRYSAILNDQGGVVDDCVALRLSEEEWYLVTNAGPLDQVAALLQAPGVEDVTAATTKIDVQGPAARDVLLALGVEGFAALPYWTGGEATWRGTKFLITRAGYTGELGYELFVPNEIGHDLWRALLAHPATMPCGLGARDTLRTEAGYPLNGEDLLETKTPLESGMGRFICWEKEFPGKARMQQMRDEGNYTRLTAIKTADRRAPRHGMEIQADGQTVGVVTSGTFGPSVGTGVGLADLRPEYTAPGTQLTAGPRALPVVTAEIPIYTKGTCRMKFT